MIPNDEVVYKMLEAFYREQYKLWEYSIDDTEELVQRAMKLDSKYKTKQALLSAVEVLQKETKKNSDDISDGYHTFGELYDHRRALTAALFTETHDLNSRTPLIEETPVWRSKQHHPDDSPMFEGGYFIVGATLFEGQISYHYKLKHWDDFRNIPEIPHAPKWDGHTPQDTVERLLRWARA